VPTLPSGRRLRAAAESRAAGNAWEKVALDAGRPLAVVREWPKRYPTVWRKAFAEAARRSLAEATAEAVVVLRKQLRSKSEKSVREAGLKLVQIRVALEKVARTADDTNPSDSPPGYADRLLASVRGMTDEQLEAEIAAATAAAATA
jgi:hypothetical protein